MKLPLPKRKFISKRQRPARNNDTRYARRRSWPRRTGILTALILLGIYTLMQYFAPQWMTVTASNPVYRDGTHQNTVSGSGSALRINDGDTITLDGQRIRFKGMDTPETKQNCALNGKKYACGRRATEALRNLIGNKTVTCTTEGKDRYNRILAFCKAGDIDLNRSLVQQGWAVAYGMYQREEAQARKEKRGLWAGRFERPGKWRQNNR